MAIKPEAALRVIAARRGDAICVPTMTAAPAWRAFAPDDLSVTCVGFMGGASSLGLGLALARPERRVLVLDGDGSLLMQLGSLATIAGAAPPNLVHFVFRNGVYHTSGAQAIPGGLTVDFVLMARAAGYRRATAIAELAALERELPALLAAEGPMLVELHTGLADQTPMTAPRGVPLHEQAEALRARLLGLPPAAGPARAAGAPPVPAPPAR
jgi:phosphonopyruvate decarboxylase